jgi:hypothetical protein
MVDEDEAELSESRPSDKEDFDFGESMTMDGACVCGGTAFSSLQG